MYCPYKPNNLLENREMALEDGRFLMMADKYDALLKKLGKVDEKFVRTSEKFLVIALGLPTLNGEILSMFSFLPTRPMHIEEEKDVLNTLFPGLNSEKLQKLVQVAQELRLEKDINGYAIDLNNSLIQGPYRNRS